MAVRNVHTTLARQNLVAKLNVDWRTQIVLAQNKLTLEPTAYTLCLDSSQKS